MLSTIIVLISGVLGIFWSFKARNSFTKLTGSLLAIASMASVVNYASIHNYAFYAVSLFCLMAAYEPFDSTRIKKRHRVYFALSGVLFAVVTIDTNVVLPFLLILWPFVVAFFIVTIWMIVDEPKMIRTRLGYICVWLGLGLLCIVNAI